jgi:dihydroorotase
MFDLPMTMTKLLALGMELPDIVTATTTTPARILGLAGEVGTIRVGAAGDVAISEVRDESFTIYDAHMQTRQAQKRIRNVATVVNGRLLEPRLQPRAAPWMELTDAAQRAEESRHAGISPDPADILREPEEFREAIPRELRQ